MEETLKDNERKMRGKECNIRGICMQMKGAVLLKRLKPTKQLLDPFPSLFRNAFWLHIGSRTC